MRNLASTAAVACSVLAAVPFGPASAANPLAAGGQAAGTGFDQPHSWKSDTLKGVPETAAGFDPINLVLVLKDKQQKAGQADDDMLAALRREKGVFWNEVGIGRDALKGNCISAQDAAVQSGTKAAAKQTFSWRTVKCTNTKLLHSGDVTNHARVYIQRSTGAWFVAVSLEHFCLIQNGMNPFYPWHCITKNGYDEGRGSLVKQLKKLPGFHISVRTVSEYPGGKVTQAPLGYHVPYDGQVAVVTVTPIKTLLRYRAKGWKYQQVAYGGDPGFQRPSFDASKWPAGQAGFGTTGGTCPWNNDTDVHTPWDADTDMLVRHGLTIPAHATNVHIVGTIDNDADVYVNGHLVQSPQSGDCEPGAIRVTVPAKYLKRRTLLAIRGHDTGDETYLDVTVTYDLG